MAEAPRPRAFDELPRLEAVRLILRQVTPDDAPALLDVFGDREAMRFFGRAPVNGLHEARALVDEIVEYARSGTLLQWGVALKETPDTLIGTVTLSSLSADHLHAELGAALHPTRQGRGFATEATRRAIEFGFTELSLHRVYAEVDPRNHASLRLLERLGFRAEAELRGHHLDGDGHQDALVFGLLADEWAAQSHP